MSKGEQTRQRIVDEAFRLATSEGLAGVTIGALAARLGLSKSGLFAHFRSKEELQVQVIDAAVTRFRQRVATPTLATPAGLERLQVLFDRWLDWVLVPEGPGGCFFVAATAELDDHPGPARDRLVASLAGWNTRVRQMIDEAVALGHLRRGVDPAQVLFEVMGLLLACHQGGRLLGDDRAGERARTGFARLVAALRP